MNRNTFCLLLALFLHFSVFAGGMPPEANRMKEDTLPTPYSAEEIKAHCKPGHVTRHLFENEGQKSVIQTVTFLESEDPEMARFSSRQESTTGELVQDDGIVELKWKNLQAHAAFPENITTVSEEDYLQDGKTYSCWKYVVKNIVPSEDGKGVVPVEMNFWFAKELPGAPIKMIQKINDKQQTTMTMLLEKAACEEKPCCEQKACCEEKADEEKETAPSTE